jgi:hypothetical protein
MSREPDPFRIPRAGLEAAPLAGIASLGLGGNGREFVAESTLGGVLVYAIYQTLLSGLRTEAMVRRGELRRTAQVRLIGRTVWASMKEGTAVSLGISVLLLVFPWLAGPLTLLGVVGFGKASLDLFHAFWDGLSDGQRRQLHEAAYEAGVQLGSLLRRENGSLEAGL